jgi:ribonuclease E
MGNIRLALKLLAPAKAPVEASEPEAAEPETAEPEAAESDAPEADASEAVSEDEATPKADGETAPQPEE